MSRWRSGLARQSGHEDASGSRLTAGSYARQPLRIGKAATVQNVMHKLRVNPKTCGNAKDVLAQVTPPPHLYAVGQRENGLTAVLPCIVLLRLSHRCHLAKSRQMSSVVADRRVTLRCGSSRRSMRRGRDSNPRTCWHTPPEPKSGTFGPSVTPPRGQNCSGTNASPCYGSDVLCSQQAASHREAVDSRRMLASVVLSVNDQFWCSAIHNPTVLNMPTLCTGLRSSKLAVAACSAHVSKPDWAGLIEAGPEVRGLPRSAEPLPPSRFLS